MASQVSHFDNCNLKDFYESMLYAATKMNGYLDILATHNYTSGTYIDAQINCNEWEKSYDNARIALVNKFGDIMANKIEQMINSDIELINQRKKLFG
jgi:hypothetical protein